MRQIRQFLTLSGLTAVEAVRQPICLILTASCVIITALTPMMLMHGFGEGGRLARDTGLALHFVLGLFVAGYSACSTLSREISSGTASAVLSKPVSREVFFLAKFLGIAAVIVAFSLCASISTLLAERISIKFVSSDTAFGYVTDWQTGRLLLAMPPAAFILSAFINYRFRRPFESTAFWILVISLLAAALISGFFDRSGRWAPYSLHVQWRILPASMLICMALIVLAAIALSLSTRLSTVPTLGFCSGIFLFGLMSDYLIGRLAGRPGSARLLYHVLPNWQHFWSPDALGGGGSIPLRYLCLAGLYGLIYCAGVLSLGMLSFRHADMK